MLKLTKLFFALTLILSLTACGDDDNASPSDPADLVGTWSAVSFDADISTTTTVLGIGVSVTTTALASNLAYDLTFTDAAFSTSGSFDMTTSGTASGIAIPESTSSYTNITESGTYTTEDNNLMINGSLFSFDFNGAPVEGLDGEQTFTYEINSNNELVLTQSETIEASTFGTTVSTTTTTNSVWTKQ